MKSPAPEPPDSMHHLEARGFRSWFVLLILALVFVIPANAADDPLETRVITDRDGRILRGQIIAIDRDTVTVRRVDDGEVFALSIETLATQDQLFLKRDRSRILDHLTPPPVTDFLRALHADFAFLNTRATGLETPPEDAWERTQRFVVLYGFPEDPEFIRSLGEKCLRIQNKNTAVLWIGPRTLDGRLMPEIDLKLARLLPAGIAVLRYKALTGGIDAARAELERLAEEQSPGEPNLFHTQLHRRTAAERKGWHSRMRAALPLYWPTGGYLPELGSDDPTNLIAAIYVLDRNGANLRPDPDLKEAFTGFKFGKAPPVIASPKREPAKALSAPLVNNVEPQIHTFINKKGRSLRVWIMAIGSESVRVRTIDGGKELLLAWTELTEADRLLLTNLKQDARYLPPPPPVPLPPRKNAELERLRVARLAVSVFIGDQANRSRVLRWNVRPQLDVRGETPEIEALIRSLYNDLCAAAGMTGLVDPEHKIFFAAGSEAYLQSMRSEIKCSVPHRAGLWSYNFSSHQDGTLKTMFAMVRIGSQIDLVAQQKIAQCVGLTFGGLIIDDPQWQESIFMRKPSASSFTDLDRRLFRILYRHVPPAARKDEILVIVPRHWMNPDATPDEPAK